MGVKQRYRPSATLKGSGTCAKRVSQEAQSFVEPGRHPGPWRQKQPQRSRELRHRSPKYGAPCVEPESRAAGLDSCSSAAGLSDRIAFQLRIPRHRNIFSALMLGYPKHGYRKTVPRKTREMRWM